MSLPTLKFFKAVHENIPRTSANQDASDAMLLNIIDLELPCYKNESDVEKFPKLHSINSVI